MLTESEFTDKVRNLCGQVYIAGGWVRDLLLGRPANDKDYVVCGIDKDVLESEFDTQPVGHQFPVYLLKIDGTMREVALARTERKTGRGYRGFAAAFSRQTTITEDLYRRDTRMNSMALRLPDMRLIDPFNGQADIRDRVIRATSRHFCEDPVRALRAARQAAQLDFSVAPETIALMRLCRDEVFTEPSERIFGEMRKALEAPKPHVFFQTLFAAGLLDVILPELGTIGTPSDSPHHGSDPEIFARSMSALQRVSALSLCAETRLAAFLYSIDLALTSQENCSHTQNRDLQGLYALDCLSRRMTLPRQWGNFIRFTLTNYADIKRAQAPEEIVKILLDIQKHGFAAREIAAFVRADCGVLPAWLDHAGTILSFLDSERKNIRIPEALPPAQRSGWIVMKLARAFTNHVPFDSKFVDIG